MAVAGGFMISAAGNRDKVPGDRPVLRGREGGLLGPQWPGSCDTGAQKSWQEGLLTVTKELPTQGVKFSMTWEVAGWHGLS